MKKCRGEALAEEVVLNRGGGEPALKIHHVHVKCVANEHIMLRNAVASFSHTWFTRWNMS